MVKPETLKVGKKAAAKIEIRDKEGNSRYLVVWGPITKISMFGDRVHLVTIEVTRGEVKPYQGSPDELSESQIKSLFKSNPIPKTIQVTPQDIYHAGDSKEDSIVLVDIDSKGESRIHVIELDKNICEGCEYSKETPVGFICEYKSDEPFGCIKAKKNKR